MAAGVFALCLCLCLLSGTNAELFTEWKPYVSEIKIPKVIDMRKGGRLRMEIGKTMHEWGGGMNVSGQVYGYAMKGEEPTYPGPTILTSRNKLLSVQWKNKLTGQHILHDKIAPELITGKSSCYPQCGVPSIVHVHGLETSARFDGLPQYSIGAEQVKEDIFFNKQLASTMVYHDHAMGLTRLNVWAGLVGAYVLEDKNDEKLGVKASYDIPIILQDKQINVDGSLNYPDSPCSMQQTKWAPEGFGNVNVVNGVVMPFINVPQDTCRFRLINAANARTFTLDIPFAAKCKIIAKDSGYVKFPVSLSPDTPITLFPFERVEILCDFRNVPLGTNYDVKDSWESDELMSMKEVFQVRVTESNIPVDSLSQLVPILNDFKDLKALWRETNGATKNITLNEEVDADDCPVKLTIAEEQIVKSYVKGDVVTCKKGTVEKWNFKNPTADFHPFHWHVVHFQCGPDDDNVNTNELKDVFPIPNAEGQPDTITQVCYVACTPGEYLVKGSNTSPSNFGFPTKEPYLIHCHILEHEENEMMTWFSIT